MLTAPDASTLRLSAPEVSDITGGLTQPAAQIRALHEAGFWRARLGRDGSVVLERAHYEAVCAGALKPVSSYSDRPRVISRV